MSVQAPAGPPSTRAAEGDHGQKRGARPGDRPGPDTGSARARPQPIRRRPSPETVRRILGECVAPSPDRLMYPADLARALQAATGASRATCFRAIADATAAGAIFRV